MPKNKVQFQKGLSLPNFLAQYSAEQQGREALSALRWPNGFICPSCNHEEYSLISTRLLYQCSNFHRQTSLISGTIFYSTKLSLTTWFLAICFITQSKEGISSLNLSRIIGISVNAAQRMKHKLQQVMKNWDDAVLYPALLKWMMLILVVSDPATNEAAVYPVKLHLFLLFQ